MSRLILTVLAHYYRSPPLVPFSNFYLYIGQWQCILRSIVDCYQLHISRCLIVFAEEQVVGYIVVGTVGLLPFDQDADFVGIGYFGIDVHDNGIFLPFDDAHLV